MSPRYFALLAALSLTGCIGASTFASHNVEMRIHRTIPAAGATQISVVNVAGSIAVIAWDRPNVDVSALVYGADQGAVNRTHVVTQGGSGITVKTEYDNNGGIFGNNNGAEVDYTIRVPKMIAVSVTNISGPTTLTGLAGNLDASEISGRLDATLGRLAGTRSVRMNAISGRITVRIARDSSARVNTSTLSGSVNLFFPSDLHQGVVGNSATGLIGKGTSSMTLHTVSGPIAVEPE
jgi:DUF4097 and DUF4098 domain-containing protein YvlB